MQDKIRIDFETGLYVEVVHPNTTGEDIIDTPCTESFYLPKWNGEAWEEAGTPPEPTPQEPSEAERLEALEMLMVDILGGEF